MTDAICTLVQLMKQVGRPLYKQDRQAEIIYDLPCACNIAFKWIIILIISRELFSKTVFSLSHSGQLKESNR
jgi:hypothetical protein